MFDTLMNYLNNISVVITADSDGRAAVALEAVTRAKTRLLSAKTEYDAELIKNSLVSTLAREVETNPLLRAKLAELMVMQGGFLDGIIGSSSARQIGSSSSSSYTEPSYKRILGGDDY